MEFLRACEEGDGLLRAIGTSRQGEPMVDEIIPGPIVQTDLPRPIGPMDLLVEQEQMPSRP